MADTSAQSCTLFPTVSVGAHINRFPTDWPTGLQPDETLAVLDFAPEETFRWYEEECADIDVSRANTVYAMTESGPDPTPRMKAGNGAEFVEFVWDGKAFKLPRKRVESFETLKRTMAINKSRELKIPAVSENTFTSLFNFVKTGLYGPELLKVQNSQPWDSTIQTTSGPPEIRGTRKDWPEFLEIDIEAYKVAACLGFAEMARHAIKRLYAQHFTHNDPTDALEAIYDSEDPYEELRNFAVAFMARRLSPATASPSERFNMDILDRNLRNSGGLHDLYRRNLCFQEDVARARSKTRQPVQATPLPTFPVSTEPPWRDTISMMSRSWNEAPAIGYPDSTARMSTVASPPRPPLPPQMPPFSYGSHRSPYDTSFSMFGEPAEPPWMERNGYWEGCF
ncbi:MAG: hypothetical protein M1820_000904 [Bogoriella megaspora]|nr:MAG: hypothetical protein M1820_000904 [Bogoriella megaspora]